MRLLFKIALKHLLVRKRQSVVSLLGIILGVAFFLAISSLMQGSENDFIKRIINNSAHITITDEYREPHTQPVLKMYGQGAVDLRSVKPMTEIRGIRGYEKILTALRLNKNVQASPVLMGQALIHYAGKDVGITLNGMVAEDMRSITTIQDHMLEGSVDDLQINSGGIIIGQELARKLSLTKGESITVSSSGGIVRNFKVVGLFRTGRISFDTNQVFIILKRAQALLNRSNRINNILMKIDDPYDAAVLAKEIEGRIGYKTLSWQESSEDVLKTLYIRNIIMYTVVSAVLIVAAFGIYNVISTVVMEKHRDIAILKSMGFYARDIRRIFVIQGLLLGFLGNLIGLPLGCGLMLVLMQVYFKAPGQNILIQMPIDWSWPQFVVAGGFALVAAVFAALLPARKAASVEPIDILRGSV